MTRTEYFQSLRNELKQTSIAATERVKNGEFKNVNEALAAIYGVQGVREVGFEEMKSRNLRVIKGEKPLLYWGKKQAKSVLDEDGKEIVREYYPLVIRYTEAQLYEATQKQEERTAEEKPTDKKAKGNKKNNK